MGFTPESLRYLLLNGHYRTNIEFSVDKKHEALKVIQRINDFYDRLNRYSIEKNDNELFPSEYKLFVGKLDDDLNTSKALAIFFDWLRKTNSKIDDDTISNSEISEAINFVEKFNSIFDLLIDKSDIPKEVLDLVQKREEARANKDWNKADSIRDQIKELGWTIEDGKDGVKVKSLV